MRATLVAAFSSSCIRIPAADRWRSDHRRSGRPGCRAVAHTRFRHSVHRGRWWDGDCMRRRKVAALLEALPHRRGCGRGLNRHDDRVTTSVRLRVSSVVPVRCRRIDARIRNAGRRSDDGARHALLRSHRRLPRLDTRRRADDRTDCAARRIAHDPAGLGRVLHARRGSDDGACAAGRVVIRIRLCATPIMPWDRDDRRRSGSRRRRHRNSTRISTGVKTCCRLGSVGRRLRIFPLSVTSESLRLPVAPAINTAIRLHTIARRRSRRLRARSHYRHG